MELAENGDVVEYLRNNGAVTETVAKLWIHQLLQALRHCHRLGIAHRDVKCENLLLDKNMNLKLTDFGFARYCIDDKHIRILSATFCGSAAYVAPEVLRGLPYNPLRADVWSIGVCLYVMVSDCTPFDDSNLAKLLKLQESRNWSFKATLVMSHNGKEFVRRSLEPNVLKRPTLFALLDHPWFKK